MSTERAWHRVIRDEPWNPGSNLIGVVLLSATLSGFSTGSPQDSGARRTIHESYTILVPLEVSARPYMSEHPAAAFVARDFELQIISGDIANVRMQGAVILERTSGVVDGLAIHLELRRNPRPSQDGRLVELVADIEGQGSDGRLSAQALCVDERACAVAQRMLMSIEFPRLK